MQQLLREESSSDEKEEICQVAEVSAPTRTREHKVEEDPNEVTESDDSSDSDESEDGSSSDEEQ